VYQNLILTITFFCSNIQPIAEEIIKGEDIERYIIISVFMVDFAMVGQHNLFT